MVDWARKFLYRIFCGIALLVSVYLVLDFLISGTFDYRVFIMSILMVVVVIWGIVDWRKSYLLIQKKETELKLYQLYIQPLEELVKEIRAKQHEFDNHINAILNMHLTVDDYSELVAKQSEYITEVVKDDESRQYLQLLRISDKILAGFLYSKIVRAPSFVRTEIDVKDLEIISGISEHHLIEIVGILVDNAYEACTEELSRVMMELDSQNDRLVFVVKNRMRNVKLEDIGKFFEKGYSTKSGDGKRGLGLYRAKQLTARYGGEITVSTDFIDNRNYICLKVVI
ncbi:MAG: GHKL domain-containing protein [Coprococcus sp.]|nr:GHKL domain-containing protein [Coprococcus sp.]